MILAVLQARVSSTRLPGKVLLPLSGAPMLQRQIERVLRARSLDALVVATSDRPDDDVLQSLCDSLKVPCFRGSLQNVLDRFYCATLPFAPEHVVRLTGDCPLTDPTVIDAVVELHLQESADYTSNVLQRTFPDGLDVEIMRIACLEQAWRDAVLPPHREHVTSFIYSQPERYRLANYKQQDNLSRLRWTVDELADYEFVKQVYSALYPVNESFTTQDVLRLLEESGISDANARSGQSKS